MAQQHTPAAGSGQSPGFQQPGQLGRGALHILRRGVAHLTKVVAQLCLAGTLVGLSSSVNAAPVPAAGALLDQIPSGQTGPAAVSVGADSLGQGPRADWITGLVEFLSAVPPECRTVPNKQPKKECEQRERGMLERFKESHPVAFNLVVMAITLLAGFYIGGGFQGGK